MFSPVYRPSSVSIFSIALVLLAALSNATGQEAARPDRGGAMNRNYIVSDVESINLQNGNVGLSIPLASLPPIAGGKLSWTISANYNSKLWNVTRVQEEPLGAVFLPYLVNVPVAGGGWTIGGKYAIEFRNANDDFDRIQYNADSGLSQGERDLLNNHQWWKVLLVMPDGSEHELRPLDHGSYAGGQDFLRGYYNVVPTGSPMRYYSLDGSFLYSTISGNLNWTVYLPDGTRIIQTPDGVQRIQDTNGNKIKIYSDTNGTHFQDEQTTREIRVIYDPTANGGLGRYRIFYPTVTGISHFIDVNMGTTTVQGKTYTVNDFDPIGETICQRTAGLSTELQVVREIVFPQTEPGQPQRKFAFSYNSDTTENTTTNVNWSCASFEDYTRAASKGWGELSRVIMPPGTIQNSAYADYTYELDSNHSLQFSTDDLAAQGISQKKLTHDGTFDIWTYAISETGSTVTSPDGNNFSEARYCATFGVPGCSTDKAGLAYRTTRPFVLTERHWINLAFSGGDNTGPGGLISPFNPVVDYEYTTLLDGGNNPVKMSAKKFQHDHNGNVTQTTEYDWFDPSLVSRDAQGVPTGVPASATVLRVANSSHYNQAVGSTSTNVYAKRALTTGIPLILNAPKEITLGPSIAQLSYDGQAYGVTPTVGNLTTRKMWVDLESKWITTSNTYGLYGNVATTTDGRGKVTQFFYDDATHALPTRVVVDPQNGTGTQTTTTSYDFSTGLVTSQTDANGQMSTVDYNNHLLGAIDPFGRPGITKAPVINIGGSNHQRRITTTYLDSGRQMIVAADLNGENDKLLKTRTTTDQLGRPVLTEQTEDGTNYTISVVNKYLDMGRVTLTSSSRRSAATSTDSWIRVTNDNAGRAIEVATFGGSAQPAWTGTSGTFTGAVITSYDVNFTTVTDQAGKLRRSMTDPLGRLRRVDEPDGSGNLGSTASPVQPTSYSYDVLGNLTTVTQGVQTRTFTYDSLSRLRSAVNPESGTVSYQYDDNGNLLVKTDARTDPLDANKKVNTHFDYDALNRITRRWYNGSNLATSNIHNTPTPPSGVGATDEAKFYYDTQSLPGGAPTYTRGATVGRLVAQTYGTGSNGDYYAYDVLGRQTLKIQQTGTINYQMSAAYTLSGAPTTLTYPSGHTVNSAYDQVGRLTALSGNLGDGNTRTYSSGILYAPNGGLVKEQFGTTTPVYNKLFYNSRGQLAEIRASTSYTGPTDTTWDRGAIVNSYSNQCIGVCSGFSMSDNNGNLLKQQIYIPGHTMRWQQYDYDSLNRLNWAREVRDDVEQWKQQFTYDRWGNRTINTSATYGTGINNKAFTVNTVNNNNRLEAPTGQPGVMTYDAAGNLTNDTYTGAGYRTYDAENKITSAWGGNNQAQLYSYDASGQRIKRAVYGVETWQVYGFGGELIAEYASSGVATNPLKEYGYRNGQLLVTANGAASLTNFALNKTATQSSAHSSGAVASRAIDGNTDGVFANNSVTHTNSDANAWWHVDLGQVQSISTIKVWNRVEFPERLTNFYVFVSDVPFTSTNLTTTLNQAGVSNYQTTGQGGFPTELAVNRTGRYIRVQLAGTNYLSLAEVQVLGTAASANVALNKSATQSSTQSSGVSSRAVDGNTDGVYANNSVTHTANELNAWWHVDLGQVETIGTIKVWNRVEFPERLTNFYVFVSDVPFNSTNLTTTLNQAGVSSYQTTGQCGFPTELAINRTGRYVRVQLTGTNYLSIAEVQVWTGSATPPVQWLISDHLGTPRMVLDQTGSLANMKRHDYLPFGEELVAPTTGRSAAQGYASGDGVRQQFTLTERDTETGLDYFFTRYHSSTQGRFISVDPENYQARLMPTDPQTWNGYSYVGNNPMVRTDPTGKGEFWEKFKNVVLHGCRCTDVEVEKRAQADEDKRRQELRDYSQMRGLGGYIIIEGPDGQPQPVSVDSLDRSQVLTISQQIRFLAYGIEVGGIGTISHDDALKLIGLAITPVPATGPTAADQISNGHAWSKHQGEFPGWSQQKFTQKIQETINNATGADVRNLSNGRTAYWNTNEGMVVIRDPSSPHGGTAFRPTNGRVYFDNLH
jgi:RHS repeat-associated protein